MAGFDRADGLVEAVFAPQPLVVGTVRISSGIFDNRKPVFQTNNITQPTDRSAGTEKIPKFLCTVQRGRIEDYMRVDMFFVNMGADKKSVLAFQETHGKFVADFVRLFRCDLSRLEGLTDLVCDYVAPLFASGDLAVLPFGQQKLRIGGVRITLVCGDQFLIFCFVGIFYVVGTVSQAFCNGLPAVLV